MARAPAARTKTSRTARRAAPAAVTPPSAGVSLERRRELIAEAAYFRAAARGFTGGDAVADWLESEREVDALLSRSEG